MKKKFLTLPFIAGLIIYNANIYAQTCLDWPADCPAIDYPSQDRVEDSTNRLGNPIVPQEVNMEFRMRELTGRLMRQVAAKQHWEEPVEIDEGGSSGYRDLKENVLEYSLRPPHWFTITWRIVVNRDSLNKWLEWLNDLGTRSKANMDEYANKMDGVKDLYKSYMDSANHYVDLKANYMNLHYEEYTKALTAGDKTAIAAYEKGMAAYDNKMNAFVKKAGDLQKDPGAEKVQNNIQDERQKMSLIFRESTVLLIEFSFNPDRIVLSDCVPVKATPAIPGFKLLRWYDNPNPDLTLNLSTFLHSKNIAIGLLGGWNTIPDARGDYSPLFRINKTTSDKVTPKKIKSDQLQSLCIYGSGNKSAIQKFFADLDTEELNKIIIKNE